MKVLLSSIALNADNILYNFDKIMNILFSYIDKEIDLFVFGEASVTGLSISSEKALNIQSNNLIEQISDYCIKNHCAVCSGCIELDSNKYFITNFIINSSGVLLSQKKLFPGNPLKRNHLSSGKIIDRLSFNNHSTVILSCADFLLPEPILQAGLLEPSLVLSPTDNFKAENLDTIYSIAKARAIELCAPIIVVFNSYLGDQSHNSDYLAYLAFDSKGKELAKSLKKYNEDSFFEIDIELKPPQHIWGGFQTRKDWLADA